MSRIGIYTHYLNSVSANQLQVMVSRDHDNFVSQQSTKSLSSLLRSLKKTLRFMVQYRNVKLMLAYCYH